MAFDVPHHEEGEDEESRLHQQEQDPDGEGERPQLAATSENHLVPVLGIVPGPGPVFLNPKKSCR